MNAGELCIKVDFYRGNISSNLFIVKNICYLLKVKLIFCIKVIPPHFIDDKRLDKIFIFTISKKRVGGWKKKFWELIGKKQF